MICMFDVEKGSYAYVLTRDLDETKQCALWRNVEQQCPQNARSSKHFCKNNDFCTFCVKTVFSNISMQGPIENGGNSIKTANLQISAFLDDRIFNLLGHFLNFGLLIPVGS